MTKQQETLTSKLAGWQGGLALVALMFAVSMFTAKATDIFGLSMEFSKGNLFVPALVMCLPFLGSGVFSMLARRIAGLPANRREMQFILPIAIFAVMTFIGIKIWPVTNFFFWSKSIAVFLVLQMHFMLPASFFGKIVCSKTKAMDFPPSLNGTIEISNKQYAWALAIYLPCCILFAGLYGFIGIS